MGFRGPFRTRAATSMIAAAIAGIWINRDPTAEPTNPESPFLIVRWSEAPPDYASNSYSITSNTVGTIFGTIFGNIAPE